MKEFLAELDVAKLTKPSYGGLYSCYYTKNWGQMSSTFAGCNGKGTKSFRDKNGLQDYRKNDPG